MRRGRAVPGPLSMPSSAQAVTRSADQMLRQHVSSCASPRKVERAATEERRGRPLTARIRRRWAGHAMPQVAPFAPFAERNRSVSVGWRPCKNVPAGHRCPKTSRSHGDTVRHLPCCSIEPSRHVVLAHSCIFRNAVISGFHPVTGTCHSSSRMHWRSSNPVVANAVQRFEAT